MSDDWTYATPDPDGPQGPQQGTGGKPRKPTRPDDRPVGPRSRGVPTRKNRKQTLHGLTTKQVQKLLRSRGYHISVDGKMGPKTSSAIDAYVKGKSPNQYNNWATKHFAPPSAKGGPSGVARFFSDAASLSSGGNKKGGGNKKDGTSSLGGLDPDIGTFLSDTSAGQIAGLQFDPQINQTQRALDMLPSTRAQNLHDIDHWYGQVLGSQATASKRDKEINVAGQGSVKDAIAGIIASLGGGANQGSGVVGAAGADALGMLGAEGAAQEQYNEDIRPLLQSESAGASSRESARLSQNQRDLEGSLSDLRGQRGAARAAALLDIRDKNNSLAQQQFNNNLSLEQLRQSANIAAGKLVSQASKPAKGSYAATSPTQKLGIMQTAVQTIADEDGKLRVDIPHAVQLVNSIIAGAGWDRNNPAVRSFRNQILQSVGITPQAGWR